MYNKIEKIIKEAGNIMLSAKEIDNSVTEKEGPANFVTKYDVKVQEFLYKNLLELYPDAHFVGEENDQNDDVLHGLAFIVDPIDGTTNFIQHMDASAISVALLKDGEVILGATYNPYRDQFFFAEKGKGATCNGKPIHVSDTKLKDSIVCLGTSPYYPEKHKATTDLAYKLLTNALDLRRSGSAVIDICEVAKGSAGLMYEMLLSPWDYAAASLILTEAGGVITQMDGSPIIFHGKCSVLCGNPKAHRDFFNL